MAFCRIQKIFIRDIRAKFGIPNSCQPPDTGQNSGSDISDFQISGQSFINENYHNFRNSHNIDINSDQQLHFTRATRQLKKNDFDVISVNYDAFFFRFITNL